METLPVVLPLSYYLERGAWLGLEMNWFLCRNSLLMSKDLKERGHRVCPDP